MMKKFRIIPDILRAIREADLDKIGCYENIMVSMYSSSLLFAAAIANFTIRFFVLSQPVWPSLWDSVSLALLGAGFILSVRTKLSDNLASRIIAALSFITMLYYTIRFYDVVGPVVWIAIFLQMTLAMIRITKEMCYAVRASAVLSIAYILYHAAQSPPFQMTPINYIIFAVLSVLMMILAAGVHRVNVERYHNLEAHYQDIKQKKQEIYVLNNEITATNERTKCLAYHDSLTGLPNRLLLVEHIDHAISLASRLEKMVIVFFLDLDGFKMVNGTLGHGMGDALLIDVSERLSHSLRKSDTLARVGEDEFVIVVENIEFIDSIHLIGNKLLRCFEKPFLLNRQEWFVSASIGVSVYPTDGDSAEELMKNADLAMFRAKDRGKNQYVLCSPQIKASILETMKLNNHLYRALSEKQLELYYQPQVSCVTGQITGVEALIRWNHPELGIISPNKFIPIAEQSGLILSIGEWVILTACRQQKAWLDAGYPPIRVAVNLSVKQLQHPGIVKQVESILRETGLDPRHLEMEVTESYAMMKSQDIAAHLNAFKKMGVRIAIDDFGTQYSTMTYLKAIPADIIKIDKLFVKGITLSTTDEAIIKSMIVLARNTGLRVVAEGVETREQRDFLIREMCDEIQGFYYYRPMPLHELEKVLLGGTPGFPPAPYGARSS